MSKHWSSFLSHCNSERSGDTASSFPTDVLMDNPITPPRPHGSLRTANPITPPRPYGSSRTTGGLFRGNAYGNAPSHADFEDENVDYLGPVETKPVILEAKVYLYVSPLSPADVDLAITKPMSTVTVKAATSLGPVLEAISAKWSPIKRKLNFQIIIIIVI
jgi:hypothetical protein